ncbi:MAG TPA: hypothetical protein VIW93_05780 [Candidatus Acidoferrum sp.]
MSAGANAFPILRWVALSWLVVWLPSYVWAWGWANLLHLCDMAVILGCVGIWWGSSLLISSQAVGSLAAGILWVLDVGWRLTTGRFFVGGTDYMWDARYPLWVRLLSCFHIGLPLALLWAMRKVGYDRRALALQAAIAVGLFVAARFLPQELNLNYAYRDPLFHRAWGPAPVHLAVIFFFAVVFLYWPTHLLLGWMFPLAGATK